MWRLRSIRLAKTLSCNCKRSSRMASGYCFACRCKVTRKCRSNSRKLVASGCYPVLAKSGERMVGLEAALQLVMKLSKETALHGEMCVSGLLKCLHDLPSDVEGVSCAAMAILLGAVVGKELQYERHTVATHSADSVNVLMWVVQECTKPAAIDVRIAGVQAIITCHLFKQLAAIEWENGYRVTNGVEQVH